MTITTDMLARIAVVVLAVIISIAINRRKALFTVKNASGPEQVQAIQGFADRSLRDVNILIQKLGPLRSRTGRVFLLDLHPAVSLSWSMAKASVHICELRPFLWRHHDIEWLEVF
ncbi:MULTISPECIES: hypothetical protein [Pseudomonas]|uniref:hypothetical protein n=1 Tax=Pseudomonas TaxID=286 RepID=UPI000A98A11C|nr:MULTISPECIES: hypothetical protein [Pseudomonas]